VAPQLGWRAETNSRGVAFADLDNDGALDVVITHQFAQNDRRALFGLGAFAEPLSVSIGWCGGPARVLGPFALDRYHVVEQADHP